MWTKSHVTKCYNYAIIFEPRISLYNKKVAFLVFVLISLFGVC